MVTDEREQEGLHVVDLPVSDETKAAVEQARRAMPTLVANADIMATIRRANYEALIRAGFNDAQALELCWK